MPYREQAGSQRGRGCIEHIVTLRLIIDFARKKKSKLFVTFVDFATVYDRVPRAVLFIILKRLGCGAVMLAALVSMYTVTQSIIGTAVVTAVIGVRQGSPTSCLLFIIFVNDLIALIKSNSGTDGFLMWLHMVVLMDDTVILSTTRHGMEQKLILLNQYCQENGMLVNNMKTKFFALNCSPEEQAPFIMGGMVVEWCNKYVYLGSLLTADGSLSSAIAAHAEAKMCHVLKYVSFLEKKIETSHFM